MDLGAPHTAICPTLDSGVLAVLARTTHPLTGREVARLVGRPSHRGVLDVLSRLTDQGLVDREEAGRAFLFMLNREHLAAPAVEVLANLRTELTSRLSTEISGWHPRPVHVSLFGSAARGGGDIHSDIDLLVIRPENIPAEDPAWEEQRDRLGVRIRRWTGNHAGVAEVTEKELIALVRRRAPIVAELRSDAITLFGGPLSGLLGASR
jgi:hypothetical protein